MSEFSPLGDLVELGPGQWPGPVSLKGRYVDVEPLRAAEHGDGLWEELGRPEKHYLWHYMRETPPGSREEFQKRMEAREASRDPMFLAILEAGSGRVLGSLAFMRIDAPNRVIEVGHVQYGTVLQRTRGATEVQYLLMKYVFEELGYRRHEWKTNDLNEPSRRAALRLGFQFEGIFRQHMIIQGRNRHTAWYSMLDGEWPERKAEFDRWLAEENFDAQGQQRTPLRHAQTLG
jgi:RimJ/RimL family protein N-acetyltransferase